MQLLDLITIFIFALGIVIMGLSFSGKGRNMKSFSQQEEQSRGQ